MYLYLICQFFLLFSVISTQDNVKKVFRQIDYNACNDLSEEYCRRLASSLLKNKWDEY